MAGIVGGKTFGVAKEANLIACKVVSDTGRGSFANILAAVDYVMEMRLQRPERAAIMNLSLGGSAREDVNLAMENAVRAGVVAVVSAGNNNYDACQRSPASANGVLTVGATTPEDLRTSQSNFGPCVDLYAPGWGIESATSTSDDAVQKKTGTSMAVAFVTGAAALYLESNQTERPVDLIQTLLNDATMDVLTNLPEDTPNRLLYTGNVPAKDLSTGVPSVAPSTSPSQAPSLAPSRTPSLRPSKQPNTRPSVLPSRMPSVMPSTQLSTSPSLLSSVSPSKQPTWATKPTELPSAMPSIPPSSVVSLSPSTLPSALSNNSPATSKIQACHWVDARNDVLADRLEAGVTYQRQSLPRVINVVCSLQSGLSVDSVQFDLDGSISKSNKVEQVAPYTLCGDKKRGSVVNYLRCDPRFEAGDYQLHITPQGWPTETISFTLL